MGFFPGIPSVRLERLSLVLHRYFEDGGSPPKARFKAHLGPQGHRWLAARLKPQTPPQLLRAHWQSHKLQAESITLPPLLLAAESNIPTNPLRKTKHSFLENAWSVGEAICSKRRGRIEPSKVVTSANGIQGAPYVFLRTRGPLTAVRSKSGFLVARPEPLQPRN